MAKSNVATVIDFEAFRQRKQQQERMSFEPMPETAFATAPPVFVPVWFCWVPAWSPIFG